MKYFKKLFLTACLIFSVQFSVSALSAKVISTTGKVEVQEGSMWVALEPGDTVERGDIISTGFKSQAVFEVKGSKFTLGPLTRITIEQLLSSKEKDSTQVYLDSGSISAEVNRDEKGKAVGFKVRATVATASVRGTGFSINSAGDLKVRHGTVGLTGPESKRPQVQDYIPDYTEEVTESAPVTSEVAETPASSESVSEEIAEVTEEAQETTEEVAAEETVIQEEIAEESSAASEETASEQTFESSTEEAVASAETETPATQIAKSETEAAVPEVDTMETTTKPKYETKVSAGQQSSPDSVTGTPSNPKDEKIASASGKKGTTTSASNAEAAGASSHSATAPTQATEAAAGISKTGSFIFTIEFTE